MFGRVSALVFPLSIFSSFPLFICVSDFGSMLFLFNLPSTVWDGHTVRSSLTGSATAMPSSTQDPSDKDVQSFISVTGAPDSRATQYLQVCLGGVLESKSDWCGGRLITKTWRGPSMPISTILIPFLTRWAPVSIDSTVYEIIGSTEHSRVRCSMMKVNSIRIILRVLKIRVNLVSRHSQTRCMQILLHMYFDVQKPANL